MDIELKSMLQSVIEKALEPINKRLDYIESVMATKDDLKAFATKQDLKKVETKLSNMATKQDLVDFRVETKSRFDTIETILSYVESDVTVVRQDVAMINSTIGQVDEGNPQTIMGMLKEINGKLEEKDFEVQALNKRLFRVETAVER